MLYFTLFGLLFVTICALVDEPSCTDADRSGSYLVPKYLLYDVNPPEGFNLRRDVYMRMATFMHNFATNHGDWHLVLPSWHHLYHWRTQEVGLQVHLPWSMFFDVESMAAYAPVIEMHQFLKETGGRIGQVYVLQHFKDAFSENWDWDDKWHFEDCRDRTTIGTTEDSIYRKQKGGHYLGWFWGYNKLIADHVKCVSFQGPASQISDLLLLPQDEEKEDPTTSRRSVMVDRAEVALHKGFGDADYWRCRRSMRFSKHLVEEAAAFREDHLNSSDVADDTVRPPDWRSEKKLTRRVRGGPYLSVHMRRQDFVRGGGDRVPASLRDAAKQIGSALTNLSLSIVFVATDAPYEELVELKKMLSVEGFKVAHYSASLEAKQKFKDGGLAIIDQIICSHARHFIGSHESTFSFRIQEEREIMGFPVKSTFNRLCPSAEASCSQPTRWKIVF